MRISDKFVLKEGLLYKVKSDGGWNREDSGMFKKGEVVMCEKIYPHVALMRRVRKNIFDGKHARECYPLQCIGMALSKL